MIIKRLVVALFTAFLLFFNLASVSFADGGGPVTVENQNLIVYPVDKQTVGVVQIMSIKNDGNDKTDNLNVYLPEGYEELQIRQGLDKEKVEKSEKGIVGPAGLKPGEKKQVMVSYQMPMEKGSSTWTIEQAYVTKSINVVIQPGVLSFEASDLVTQSELFEMNEQQFRRFKRLDLHPNVPWTLSFKVLQTDSEQGAAAANNNAGQNNPADQEFTEDGKRILAHEHGGNYLIAIVTIIIIVVALTVALIGLKRDGVRLTNRSQKSSRSWLKIEKQNVLQQIGQLEKDYQSQLISENTYETTFQKLRNQLVRISVEVRGD
jgi:hypothetical protein